MSFKRVNGLFLPDFSNMTVFFNIFNGIVSQEESIGEGEEEGTWMGKSQGGEVHQQTNSFMRKRGGPP